MTPNGADAPEGYSEADDVDTILDALEDEAVQSWVERLSAENRERLRHYLNVMLDQGYTGDPDKMVRRARKKMIDREYD